MIPKEKGIHMVDQFTQFTPAASRTWVWVSTKIFEQLKSLPEYGG